MKKYIAIAALLGLFLFAGVSIIAHAQYDDAAAEDTVQDDGGYADDEGATNAPVTKPVKKGRWSRTPGAKPAPRPSIEQIQGERANGFAVAHEECMNTALSAEGPDGGAATDAGVLKAYKGCMQGKMFTQADIDRYTDPGEDGMPQITEETTTSADDFNAQADENGGDGAPADDSGDGEGAGADE